MEGRNRSKALAARALALLRHAAVPADVAPMEAYMKGVQPFLGVKKPARVPIVQELGKEFAPRSADEFQEHLSALFAGEFREQRYVALDLGRKWKKHLALEHLPWLGELVRVGAWWDLVDELAQHFVGPLWLAHRPAVSAHMDRWIGDEDLWIRRTAVIGQNRHRAKTDGARLFRYCRERAPEKDFFMRKAIGWALREYSKCEPEAVREFLERWRDVLSGLSYREGSRLLE